MPKNREGLSVLVISFIVATMATLYSAPGGVAKTTNQQASTKAQIQNLRQQLHKSKSVVNFWGNKGRWALYLHRDKCWQVKNQKGRKTCAFARGSLRFHKAQAVKLDRRLTSLLGPEWCRELSGNRKLGCQMADAYWSSENEWRALEQLWQEESKWDEHANNPASDACGIPQAMNNCSYGYSPKVQIAWGLRYIQGRYGSPSNALASFYSRNPHWY